MSTHESATRFACECMGLKPAGSPSKRAGKCAFCGAPFGIGDPVAPLPVSPLFTDGRLLVRDSDPHPLVCGYCIPFCGKSGMRHAQHAIICEAGLYPTFSMEARAYFLLNPPPTPFLVLSSPIKNSLHIIWKASLTHDPDHWLVQFGNRTLTVRRKLFLRIAEITKELSDAMILASTSEATAPASPHKKGKKPKKKAAKRRPMLNPYQSLDYTLSDGRTGVLRTDVEQFLQQTGRLDDLRTLQSARLGELWALPAVLFRGDKAEKPKPTFPK